LNRAQGGQFHQTLAARMITLPLEIVLRRCYNAEMALDPKRRAQLEREGARSRKDVEEWLFDQDEKATRRWSRIKQRATFVSLLALILVLLVTIVARTLLHRSRNNRTSMIEQHVTAAGFWSAATERAVDLP
jgi:hypothetical protein